MVRPSATRRSRRRCTPTTTSCSATCTPTRASRTPASSRPWPSMAGMEKNPQMIMWDPATYPDVETIADLGKTGAIVRYFGGAAYMEYFTQQRHPPGGPGRRQLRRHAGQLHRRRGQGRPAGLRLGRAVQVRVRVRPTGASRSPTSTSTTPAGRTTASRSPSRPTSSSPTRPASRSSCRSSSSPASTTWPTRPRPTRSSSPRSPSSTASGRTARRSPSTPCRR